MKLQRKKRISKSYRINKYRKPGVFFENAISFVIKELKKPIKPGCYSLKDLADYFYGNFPEEKMEEMSLHMATEQCMCLWRLKQIMSHHVSCDLVAKKITKKVFAEIDS